MLRAGLEHGFWCSILDLRKEPNEKKADQMRVGLYGKPGPFRAGIHEALVEEIRTLGWRPIRRNPAPFTRQTHRSQKPLLDRSHSQEPEGVEGNVGVGLETLRRISVNLGLRPIEIFERSL